MADASGLEQLLDDALDGFDVPPPVDPPSENGVARLATTPGSRPPIAVPVAGEASAYKPPVGRGGTNALEEPASTAGTSASKKKPRPKSKFDPLAKFSLPAAPRDAPPDDLSQQELDALADGLANLMAELAATAGEGDMRGADVNNSAATRQASSASTSARSAASGSRFSSTLQRMAEETANAAVAEGDVSDGASRDSDAMLDYLTKSMREAIDAPDGAMDGFVNKIMAQLLSKDVLYGPMKEIGGAYPEWLARNAAKLPPDERERYQKQDEHIRQICMHFETHGDSKFQELVQLLQVMQHLGPPPQEIMDQMSSDMAGDRFGVFGGPGSPPDGGCPMQ